ncbi:hypothetical protein ABIA30_002123 [Mycobacterium sp. MAA66]|uniref:hypothetical protein n=1 Tax=Mycobacterium sp. MAA66 TaxID=3156297 RepID=UPI003519510A
MSNPTGPQEHLAGELDSHGADETVDPDAVATEIFAPADVAATEIFEPADPATDPAIAPRLYTAPSSFDGKTQIFDPVPDPETELFPPAGPQVIPGRGPRLPRDRRSWGWVIALVLVIAAIVAVAILGTVLLTQEHSAHNAEWPVTTRNLAILLS